MVLEAPLDARTGILLNATKKSLPVSFRYEGGSTPGMRRIVLPRLLYHWEDSDIPKAYCYGWCATAKAPRLFRSDRIHAILPVHAEEMSGFPLQKAQEEYDQEIKVRWIIQPEGDMDPYHPLYSSDNE